MLVPLNLILTSGQSVKLCELLVEAYQKNLIDREIKEKCGSCVEIKRESIVWKSQSLEGTSLPPLIWRSSISPTIEISARKLNVTG